MTRKCTALIFLLTLGAVAAGIVAVPGSAMAQGRPDQYVDVQVILYDCGRSSISNVATCLTITNLGSIPAYDVQVAVEQRARGSKQNFKRLSSPSGATFSVAVNTGAPDHVITIAELSGLSRVNVKFQPSASILSVMSARVIGLSSYEDPFRRGNNRDELWYETSSGAIHAFLPSYYVAVSLDEVSGGSANVVVTARRAGGRDNKGERPIRADRELGGQSFFSNGCVDVVLPPGVTAASSPTFSSPGAGWRYSAGKCREYSSNAVSGSFAIGESGAEPLFRMTLPVTVTDDAIREGRCVKVEMFADPPTGTGPNRDVASDNVSEACLPGPDLFEIGEVETFTIFPCVGITDSPCDSTDDVRVRAVEKDTVPQVIVPSGTVVVHIPDRPSRMYDSSPNSVNAGTEVSWQNVVVWNADPFNAVHANWTNLKDAFAVSGIHGQTPPGHVNIRAFDGETYQIIYRMNPDTGWAAEDTVGYDPTTDNGPHDYIAEFEKLGTYKITFTAKLTHSSETGDCDTDNDDANDAFCAAETYNFHIGPIAELEVRDGGANPEVSAGQRAFTIQAINNGPAPYEGAEVTVPLPAWVRVVEALPSAGIYDAARGVWVLDELDNRLPETLTLVTDAAAGTNITAAIPSTQPYTVCIGSSGEDLAHDSETACTAGGGDWHEGTELDYEPSNNTATIAARAGLAGGLSETAPALVQAIATGPRANMVAWSEPGSGTEHDEWGPVRSWDIEYSEDEGVRWTRLVHGYNGINGYRYVIDYDVPPGAMRQYRVRARYAERVGDWTEQSVPGAAQATLAGEPGVTIRPTELTLREGGRGSYTVSLDAQPADNVVIDLNNFNPDVRRRVDRLTFTPSNWNSPQTVYVEAAQDADTADETDIITHLINQAETSAEYDYFVLPDVAVTITDDETAPRFAAGGSGITEIAVDEGGETTYQVVLATRPSEEVGDVTVNLFYPSGMITLDKDQLVFTRENWNVPQQVKVTGVEDDDLVDGDGAFICHRYSGGYAEEQCLNVVVYDNDHAGREVELSLDDECLGQWPSDLNRSPIVVNDYPEGIGGCWYTLRLNALPTGNLTVTVRVNPGSRAELDADRQTDGNQNRLVFTRDNWREPRYIGFWPALDDDAANNNDFTITHALSGGGYSGVRIPDIQVKVVDADRDRIGFRVEPPHGGLVVREGDQSTSNDDLRQAVFYMFPETQPASTVTVAMSSDNPDVRLSPSRLSFTRSNWDQGHTEGNPGKRVVVRAVQDSDAEDETATITFTVTSSDADYNGMEIPGLTVQVEDDDKEQ